MLFYYAALSYQLMLLNGTNYASYTTNYSDIKIVNFIRFSFKMQCKTKEHKLSVDILQHNRGF